jgi:hypothetical protein
MHGSCIKISANFFIFPGSHFKEWKDVDSTYWDVLLQQILISQKVLFESYIKQLQYKCLLFTYALHQFESLNPYLNKFIL